jgi:hypothetical protein
MASARSPRCTDTEQIHDDGVVTQRDDAGRHDRAGDARVDLDKNRTISTAFTYVVSIQVGDLDL